MDIFFSRSLALGVAGVALLVAIKTVVNGVYKIEQFQEAPWQYLAWSSLPCITRLHKTRLRRSTSEASKRVALGIPSDRKERLSPCLFVCSCAEYQAPKGPAFLFLKLLRITSTSHPSLLEIHLFLFS